ncbi:hypothetical protein NHX12_007608 [Muraenolepis orangiensis]|uniref:Zinc transporter ZIP10 n=1 Tax=Muraenolepis orangiensis TaxID=630683 RepID=A0A9Q0ID70_9TELE|nr:hypothetical protein NHX12_007608 [Muraenolepis orangiensis]
MRVHVHTKFCVLCVVTFLFQWIQCGDEGQRAPHHGHLHNDLQISQAPHVGRANTPHADPTADMLAEEQRFYIQQLFGRYGKKDRLDFEGFQSLLLSLGLGEVKVVGIEHEELGHDHVAHLDMLDVQEGLHTHLPAEDHDHGRAGRRPHADHTPTKCSKQEGGASPTADSGTPQDHNHTHDHHHKDHKAQDQHKHSAGHAQGHVHDHAHAHDMGHTHDHKHAHDHDTGHEHNHDHNAGHAAMPATQEDDPQQQTQSDISSGHREQLPTAPTEPPVLRQQRGLEAASPESQSQTKRPRKSARERGQRGRNRTSSPSSSPPPSPPLNSVSNKRKREAPGGPLTQSSSAPSLPVHFGAHQHRECLNLTQLLGYYGLNPDSQISQVQFTYLCPALLYQIDSRVCIHHHQPREEEEQVYSVALAHSAYPSVSSERAALVWLWGFVSITIISMLSLLGVVLVPILNQSCFKFLLTFLVALAVGTLSGDALLHLLPHAQGQHTHGDPSSSKAPEEGWLIAFDGVWKGLTALGGIYLLFIIEHCIGMVKHYKDQGGTFCARKSRADDAKIGRKLSDHKRRSDAEWLNLKQLDKGALSSSCDNGHNDTQLTELQTPESPTAQAPLARAEAPSSSPAKGKKHGHSHGGNCHTDQEMKDAGIASIAWMVIMGDGMHNFSDGLAIGAAFSANIPGGISTSVAVFCHELPHELGDFAVLLKAGMSVKQAIAYNLLSALMAYVGMAIGTAVGQYAHNVTSWIFAVTAGMFLYVALVDMLPEMLHGDSEEHKRCQLGHFLLQNLGLLTGFILMLLIAIFEDQIVFDFGFL